MAQVIPFAVYEVVTNHPLLREVEYESFEEVASCESENVEGFDVNHPPPEGYRMLKRK